MPQLLEIASKVDVDRLKKNPLALMRSALADKWFPKLRRVLYLALKRQVLEFAAEVEGGDTSGVSGDMILRWIQELIKAKQPMVNEMVENGRELGTMEIEGRSMSWASIIGPKLAEELFGKQEGVLIGDDDEFLRRARQTRIDDYLEETSKLETATSRKKYNKALKDAVEFWDEKKKRGLTPSQMAKQIRNKGLALSDSRANLMARTLTMWSYNEGVQQIYEELGVKTEEWVTVKDDLTCPWCKSMDGKTVAVRDPFIPAGELTVERRTLNLPFDIQHPPLHPHCRCVMVPVIE